MPPKPRFPLDRPLLVVDAVGLRLRDLRHAPALQAFAGRGRVRPLETPVPALTCSVQASLLTGTLPREHGVVGNGWYLRELAEVRFWMQSDRLVRGRKFPELYADREKDFRWAKLFWWFNMYSSADLSLTPRPHYHSDGKKVFALYSEPPDWQAQVQRELGEFPFPSFWGPMAGAPSSRWIVEATIRCLARERPSLVLTYLPHLDYDHQRFGPEDPRSREAVAELDTLCGKLLAAAESEGYRVLVLSEYGIEPVKTPVFVNRVLREAGFLRVQETTHGELLDAGASRAFAVADHQIAHVYLREERDLIRLRRLLEGIEGVSQVLGPDGKRELGLDHPRAGDLVLLSEHGCWFAYPYWLEEGRRPDFATSVDIHRKPGYDPAELFFDPAIPFPRLKAAWILLKKTLGFRTRMSLVPTDPSRVRGSHGLPPASAEVGPVVLAGPGLELPETPTAANLFFAD